MSPHKISTASTTTTTAVAQASMAAPFTGLKSTAAFPVTSKSNSDISSLPSNGSMVPDGFVYRENHRSPAHYDGRYWTMWKLPMFGCTDASQVLNELDEAIKAYPNSFIKIIGFDNVRQVRCISFIAYKPAGY